MTSALETAIDLIQSDKLAAKTYFSAFVRDHPEDWRGHFYLAACLANQLAYGDAIGHLERTNDLRPDDPLVCFNLGYCHRQTGNLTLAVFFLAKSAELSGWRDPRCVAVLASTLCELGHTDRALAAISRVDHKSALDPILDFYRFIIGGDSQRTATDLRRKLRSLRSNQDTVDYLVSFSMKHDFFRYSIIDDKYDLSRLISAHQIRHGLDPWDYHPETYRLPAETDALTHAHGSNPGIHWIVKARNLSGGQAAQVVTDPYESGAAEGRIVQRYISNPYLLEDRKFNLRVYFVITSLDPLEVRLWNDGIVFIAPQPFSLDPKDLSNPMIHIANLLTAGKELDKFPLATLNGHILSFADLLAYDGLGPKQRDAFRSGIVGLVEMFCQAMRSTGIFEQQMSLAADPAYPPKFIGLDVIIDEQLKPWLLEAERYAGVGGVFSVTKGINDRFKCDYLDLVLGDVPRSSELFTVIRP